MDFTPKLITVWREGYNGSLLRSDAIAGLTVAIVALPLAMALGIASGASPDKGLITAVIAGFLISALGGSRVQIGGPTGAFVVVVAGVIAAHGYTGLVLATLLAGIILVVAGYAKLGSLMRYIPTPVVTGFTAGIAVIIASSQIGDFLGLRTENLPAEFVAKWAVYLARLQTADWRAAAVGMGCLGAILVLRRLRPGWPGYLIVVAAASAMVVLLKIPVATVGTRFPGMPTTIPAPHLPPFSLATLQEVFPSAFTIAFLSGVEALLSAMVADGMTGFNHRPGPELVGQGVANMASALFGGLPATGAIARTATNVRAGGKTPLAGMLHSIFLLLFLVIAGKLIAHVPMAALAAILLVVAWGMSEVDRFKQLMQMDAGERTLLLLTFGLTIFVNLTVAIGVGVTLASLLFMGRMSAATGALPDSLTIEDPAQRAALPPGVEVFRFSGPMFFGVAREMLDALNRVGRKPATVILRMDQVPFIDSTGVRVLETFVRRAAASDTRVIFSELRAQPAEFLTRLHSQLSAVAVAASFNAALALATQ